MRVLFAMSRLLGGKTFSSQVIESMRDIPGLDSQFLFFDAEDYVHFKHTYRTLPLLGPWFPAAHVMRAKYEALERKDFDLVFLQSFDLLPGFEDVLAQVPTVLAHDSTNLLSYRLKLQADPSPKEYALYLLKRAVKTSAYRRALEHVDLFLPRTRWCARSLERDFGVEASRISVVPGAVDLDAWSPRPSPWAMGQEKLPRLLFVGNDFVRKGGHLLISMYRKHLHPHARLRIVSNDSSLAGMRLPAGVEWVRGVLPEHREDLLRHYGESDLFVFPTLKEHMGMVLVEAAASGLPLVATDVGGIGDVVEDGVNGRLMRYDASIGRWAEAILSILSNPLGMRRMGAESRRKAEAGFCGRLFRWRLVRALQSLVGARMAA